MSNRDLICCDDEQTYHTPAPATRFRMAAAVTFAAAAAVCVSCIVLTKHGKTSIGSGGALLGAYEDSNAELDLLWDTLEALKNNTRDIKEQVHAMRHDYIVCGSVTCRGSEKCCSDVLCCGAEASCCGGLCCAPGSKCCTHPVLNSSICGSHEAECRDGFVFAPSSPLSNPETWIPRGGQPERFGSTEDISDARFANRQRTLTDGGDGQLLDALSMRGAAPLRREGPSSSKRSLPEAAPAVVAEPAAHPRSEKFDADLSFSLESRGQAIPLEN